MINSNKIIVHFLGAVGVIGFLCGSYINLTNPDEALLPFGLILVMLSFLMFGAVVIIDKEKNLFYKIFIAIVFLFLLFVFTGIFRLFGVY